jgi:predicted esterase
MTVGADVVLQTIEARTHGRVLVRRPTSPGPWPTLVGFHGYAEDADIHLRALSNIPGADAWLIASVQALHPFYTRQQRIVAGWMTSQDRELAIADNLDYVGRVLDWLRASYGEPRALVFAGFSQGGAMAYRAAAAHACNGLLILAADVPPDVATRQGVRLPPVLIGRGTRDEWYTADKHRDDLDALARVGAPVENCVFEGGHEWSAAFYDAAAAFLSAVTNRES